MSVITLPTIKIKGKEYFIDSRLRELRSKTYPPQNIEFIDFNELPKEVFDRVMDVLYLHKKVRK